MDPKKGEREEFLCSLNELDRRKIGRSRLDRSGVLEIGKAVAETSRGLFSPDDWQCSKCGNVNWARRTRCNMCNAPKYTKQEERTGLGGGYDDRGVVEYVQREESDGEYDHFGRRKRKKEEKERKEQGSSGSESSEDSVEDCEDDEDLSKYDLSDWGGSEETLKQQ